MSLNDASHISFLEEIRFPDGVYCIRCRRARIRKITSKDKTGFQRRLYWCADCQYNFSVTVGTVFHNSHIPLSKWFRALQLMCSQEGGVPALRLARELEITYETAWSLARRIRAALEGLEAELCRRIAKSYPRKPEPDPA